MKQFLRLLVATSIIASMGFTGCTTSMIQNRVDTERSSSSDDLVLKESAPTTNYPIVHQEPVLFDKQEAIFNFTDTEINAFNTFQQNGYDKIVFKDMTPLSITKIWVQYGSMRLWEACYHMYNLEHAQAYGFDLQAAYNEYVLDKKDSENSTLPPDILRKMSAVMFEELENAPFVEVTPTTGYLEMKGHVIREDYLKPFDPKSVEDKEVERTSDIKIHLIKNAQGIWEMDYPDLE